MTEDPYRTLVNSEALPDPEWLAKLRDLAPESYQQFLANQQKLVDAQLESAENPATVERHRYRLAVMGNISALLAVLAVCAVAGYIAHLGATTAAATILSTNAIGLATIFVTGRRYIKKQSDSD